MKKTLNILIAGLTLAAAACTKDATNVKLPESKPKLVVHAYLAPGDTFIEVAVHRSAGYFGNKNVNLGNFDTVSGCVVQVTDGSNTVTLQDLGKGIYRTLAFQLPVTEGHTYRLAVSSPKGEVVSAETTVPVMNTSSFIIEKIDSKEVSRNNPFTGVPDSVIEYTLSMKLTNDPASLDYLRTAFTGGYTQENIIYDNVGNPIDTEYISYEEDFWQQEANEYHVDQSITGGSSTITGRIEFYKNDPWNPGPSKQHYQNFNTYLTLCSREYLHYQQSLGRHMGTQGNPFADPAPVFTNIKNGLGVFASYQMKKTTVKL